MKVSIGDTFETGAYGGTTLTLVAKFVGDLHIVFDVISSDPFVENEMSLTIYEVNEYLSRKT